MRNFDVYRLIHWLQQFDRIVELFCEAILYIRIYKKSKLHFCDVATFKQI